MEMETATTLSELVAVRLKDLPEELRSIFLDPELDSTLIEIASYYTLSGVGLEKLTDEVFLVLFLFEPITHLKENLMQALALTPEVAENIYSELELMVFFGAVDMLTEIAQNPEFVSIRNGMVPDANQSLREKLELRPDGVPIGGEVVPATPQPLTREEILRALAPKRTMQSDIQSIQSTLAENTPVTLDDMMKNGT
jgi:hypothetical protein